MKKEFSEKEYETLRQELITRLTILNNQAHSAGITIITTWAAAIALRVGMYSKDIVGYREVIVGFMAAFFFFIPIVYFIPLAVKSGENISQIASISAYIRVFHDYRTFYGNEEKYFNWETSNNLMSVINVDRHNFNSFTMKRYNGDYSILALCSFILFVMSFVDFIYSTEIFSSYLMIIVFILYCFFAVICIVSILFIHHTSCAGNTMMKKTPMYIKGYILRAFHMGLIDAKEVEDIWNELNPGRKMELSELDNICNLKDISD